eukprot:CAMPEP_0194691116 /NCGR_PEP_ID=MMETSP0295-20121207/18826_1 /TAXON_ID=39354 /ORGANISM="Heterosigma akashiwo, Strain CCMP2393" /LENGTH=587 /DNA_ID=CAMNT_0039580909 /DNA_START=90 /DNA_END=1850 /DNA_ORIENTATION=-
MAEADEFEPLYEAAAKPFLALLGDLMRVTDGGDGLVQTKNVEDFIAEAGNLPRFPVVVHRIVERARLLPGWKLDALYFLVDALRLHRENVFPAATREAVAPWLPAFYDYKPGIFVTPPQPVLSAAAQQRGGSSIAAGGGSFVTTKASHTYTFPSFAGTQGEAQNFVDSLTVSLEAAKLPRLHWFATLLNQCSGNANKLIVQNMPQYGEDFEQHSTAVTVDMRFKKANGSFTAAGGDETLIDSCGCENLMDARWAKDVLKLPVKIDTSDRARIASTGLAGAKAYFTEYIEVDVLYKSTPMRTRFYLSQDLPRGVLLGNPWLQAHGALMDLELGLVTLRRLPDGEGNPTILQLKKFGRSDTHCVNMICSFVPAAPASFMPPMPAPTVPPLPTAVTMKFDNSMPCMPMHTYGVNISSILNQKDPAEDTKEDPIGDNLALLSFVAPTNDVYFFSYPTHSEVEPWPTPPPDPATVMGDVNVTNWDYDDIGPGMMTMVENWPNDLANLSVNEMAAIACATPLDYYGLVEGDVPCCFTLPVLNSGHPIVHDISQEEFDGCLKKLLDDYKDIFDMSAPNISNFPTVQLGLKEQFR